MKHLWTLCLFLSLGSCQTRSFFASEEHKNQPSQEKYHYPDHYCMTNIKGWLWVDHSCTYMDAHFLASLVAYLRVLQTASHLNPTFHESHEGHESHEDKEHNFFSIWLAASHTALDAADQAEQPHLTSWFHALTTGWEKSVSTTPEKDYELAYKAAYNQLLNYEYLSLQKLALAMSKVFFTFFQHEHTSVFHYQDASVKPYIVQAEKNLIPAFTLWNNEMNPNPEDKKTIQKKNLEILDSIYSHK